MMRKIFPLSFLIFSALFWYSDTVRSNITSDTNRQKVVMISGSNRGIGLEVARHLKKQGYLLSLGARNIDSIPEDLREIIFITLNQEMKQVQLTG